jgi:hypothetical protein
MDCRECGKDVTTRLVFSQHVKGLPQQAAKRSAAEGHAHDLGDTTFHLITEHDIQEARET